jgi:hypothetical protein
MARRSIRLSADDPWHLRDARGVLDHRMEESPRASESDLVYRLVQRSVWRDYGGPVVRQPKPN